MGIKDSRRSWIEWKMDVCGMSEKASIKAAYDPTWGYTPSARA
jgi:hypothetical protein